MSRLIIDTGTLGNPATGDTLRTAMGKINDNFLEVYDDLAGAGLGGQLTNTTTNGNVIIQPNGTGIVEVDQLQINGDNITSLITNGDLTLSGNGTGGVEVLGSFSAGSVVTNTIVSNGSNATLNIDGSGTGKVIIDAAEVEIHHDGTKVLDTSTGLIDITGSLFLTAATPTIFLKRSDNANQPAITFKSSGGTDSANILMDGTSGTTNELIFQTFADSSLSEKFRVTTGGAKVTGTLNVDDGITITDNTITTSASNANLELTAASSGTVKVIGNLTLDDSDEIKLGTSGDLRIFHNGSHSIVREDGAGSLYLQSDNNVILSKDTSTEIMVKGIADGAVELYHDNTKKFETTAGGVSVTGNLAADGSQIDFTNLPTSDPGVAGRLYRDGTTVKISV